MQEKPRLQQYIPRMMDGRRVQEPGEPVKAPVKPDGWWRRRWWQVLLIVILAAGAGWLAWGYVTTKSELAKLSGKSAGEGETKEITGQLGKFMVLPDETPTLATVNDVEKLKSQEFFKSAQNGDKVLIYSNSGRALLYRPATKKVIEYAKVDLNTTN